MERPPLCFGPFCGSPGTWDRNPQTLFSGKSTLHATRGKLVFWTDLVLAPNFSSSETCR